MLQTKILLQKLGRKITEITCKRVMVLAICTSSNDILAMYQVLFNSLLYFQEYAPDNLKSAKNRMGSNSVKDGDRVMGLAFCDFPYSPLSSSS